MWVLAHQGGWDELLLFGIPAVLAVLALRWAGKRAKQRAAEPETEDQEDSDSELRGP